MLRCDDNVVVTTFHFGRGFRCGSFELCNVHCVGVGFACSYVGNLVTTVVQSVFGQSHFIADFNAVVVHNGITSGQAVSFKVGGSSHFIGGAAVGILLRRDNDVVVAAFHFGRSFRCGCFELCNVHCVGVFLTFGNVADSFVTCVDAVSGDVHIACFQTVSTQCHFVTNFNTVFVYNGIACGEAVGFEVRCGRHFISGAAVGILLRCNNDVVITALHFRRSFRCGCFELCNVHCIGVGFTCGYVGNLVAAVVQSVFGQTDRFACFAVAHGQTVIRQYTVADSYCLEGYVV